jgi:hypothetical protein
MRSLNRNLTHLFSGLSRSRTVLGENRPLYPYKPSYLHTGTDDSAGVGDRRHGACRSMSFGKRRAYSDCIRGVSARNLLSAQDFAAAIGRGLNTAVDINWSRTTAGDDIHGNLLRSWRKAAGRFLRERGAGGLTCTLGARASNHGDPQAERPSELPYPRSAFRCLCQKRSSFLAQGLRRLRCSCHLDSGRRDQRHLLRKPAGILFEGRAPSRAFAHQAKAIVARPRPSQALRHFRRYSAGSPATRSRDRGARARTSSSGCPVLVFLFERNVHSATLRATPALRLTTRD